MNLVIKPGNAADETSVAAEKLNQTYIGAAFGATLEGGEVVYGRIAAVRIGSDYVTVHLEGVDDAGEEFSAIYLKHGEKLHFSAYTNDEQLLASVRRMEEHVVGNELR